MKIVSITTIKNESDIIESFIRYHLNIMDLMIILNNGSTDDTNYILTELKNEGLPIVILNDTDRYFEPKEKYNFLLRKAIKEFEADIVCPLDVDEFITCDSCNPRDIIENIDKFAYYKIKWRTYVPTKFDNDDLFIPSKIINIRNENNEKYFKVILTKELYYKFNVELSIGNHNITFDEKFNQEIICDIRHDLKIAHFPLRSVEQTMSKILVSYPNTLSRKFVSPNISHHYPVMFSKIKKQGTIEIEDVTNFAKQYALDENIGKSKFENKYIELLDWPMNLDFCEDIEIKYQFKIRPLRNVLENYVYFANEIHKYRNMIKD